MLRDSWTADRELFRQLADGERVVEQPREDGASRRVDERIELLLVSIH